MGSDTVFYKFYAFFAFSESGENRAHSQFHEISFYMSLSEDNSRTVVLSVAAKISMSLQPALKINFHSLLYPFAS